MPCSPDQRESAFVDGPPSGDRTIGSLTFDLGHATNLMNCGKTSGCSESEMDLQTDERQWGENNPRWQLFAYGPVNDMIPTGTLNSPLYVIVWVADDPSENDNDPTKDGNVVHESGIGRHHASSGGVRRGWCQPDHRRDAREDRFDGD